MARAINHTFRQSHCLSDSVSHAGTQSHINKYHSQRVTHTQSVTLPDTFSEPRGHAVTHHVSHTASELHSQSDLLPAKHTAHSRSQTQPVSHTAIHSLTQSVSKQTWPNLQKMRAPSRFSDGLRGSVSDWLCGCVAMRLIGALAECMRDLTVCVIDWQCD